MTNIESTLSRYCFQWGIVEAKSPAMFKDASICSKECAMYSPELGTCIIYADLYTKVKERSSLKE